MRKSHNSTTKGNLIPPTIAGLAALMIAGCAAQAEETSPISADEANLVVLTPDEVDYIPSTLRAAMQRRKRALCGAISAKMCLQGCSCALPTDFLPRRIFTTSPIARS